MDYEETDKAALRRALKALEIKRAIREFKGPQNAGLRRMIRKAVEEGYGESYIKDRVALTATGEAKLRAVFGLVED